MRIAGRGACPPARKSFFFAFRDRLLSFEFHAEVSGGAVQLCVADKQLHRSQIAGLFRELVDLPPPDGMRAISQLNSIREAHLTRSIGLQFNFMAHKSYRLIMIHAS